MKVEYEGVPWIQIPRGRLQRSKDDVTVWDLRKYSSPLGAVGGGKHLWVKRPVLTNKWARKLCAGEVLVGLLGSARSPRLEVEKTRMRGLAI